MKKFISILILILISLSLYSCAFFKEKYVEVRTAEELKASSNSNDNVKLMSDIDFENESIEAISLENFDGQGFTIRNCSITTKNYSDSASFFRIGSRNIKNVNFENITVIGNNVISAAIVSVGGSSNIENVHIINCSVQCGQTVGGSGLGKTVQRSYVGGVYGGFYPMSSKSGGAKDEKCSISNCSVNNISITLNGISGKHLQDIYAGGIAGYCKEVTNCYVENSTITVNSATTHSAPYVGGVVGESEGSIKNSFSKNNTLIASAKYYSENAFGYYATSTSYIGGLVASSCSDGNIEFCYSEDNQIVAESTGDIFAGGLIGTVKNTNVSQCYSKSNTITMSKYTNGNKSNVQRRAGGLIGLSNRNQVLSCFAYNDRKMEEQSEGFSFSNLDTMIAGLIAEHENTTINYCATFNKDLICPNTDEFTFNQIKEKQNCFVGSKKFKDSNNCKLIDEEFWLMPEVIKEDLKLEGDYWQFEFKKIPSLNFSKEE